MRLPTLDLPLPPTGSGQVRVLLLIDKLPRPTPAREGTVAAPVFAQPPGQVNRRPNVELPCRDAPKNIQVGQIVNPAKLGGWRSPDLPAAAGRSNRAELRAYDFSN